MARSREFDPETVLDRAMMVFWSKGYEATSLSDLCDATELNRSSLYASFGDKHALFLQTINRYGNRAVERVSAALSRPTPIRETLAVFYANMIDQIIAGPGRTGCFLGNCAAEVVRHDRIAAPIVRRNMERLEATFRDAFARAREQGDLSPDADIDALARFFLSNSQGLRLMGKTNADRRTLEDIAKIALRCLEECPNGAE
jgi:TetR/AcrR family transcriptional regulator, transcriptional repressor for nem operon